MTMGLLASRCRCGCGRRLTELSSNGIFFARNTSLPNIWYHCRIDLNLTVQSSIRVISAVLQETLSYLEVKSENFRVKLSFYEHKFFFVNIKMTNKTITKLLRPITQTDLFMLTGGKMLKALWGSVIGTILLLSFKPELIFQWETENFVQLLPTVIGSGIVGWLYAVATDLNKAAAQFQENLQVLNQELHSVLSPHNLLLKDSVHTGVIGTLIKDSMETGHQKIVGVNDNRYLSYLLEALNNAERYVVIVQYPIRDLFDYDQVVTFWAKLREKKMRNGSKVRLFVIPEHRLSEMHDDLEDSMLLERYWRETGSDFQTYWISENNLSKMIDGYVTTAEDYQSFDDDLSIVYDQHTRTVSFDYIGDGDYGRRIIFQLEEQKKVGADAPFTTITSPSPT